MDNRNGMRININDGSEAPRRASREPARRVATEPQATHRVATEPKSARERREAAVPGVPVGANTANAALEKKAKKPLSKKRKISIAALVVGIVVLACGLGFFLYKLLGGNAASDAEYLVQIGAWQREDAPGVIWDFTEVGKGELTTNDYLNDYDFIWALEDGELKIDTDWLVTLSDAYAYDLSQSSQTLTLTRDDETWTFVPAKDDASDKSSETTNEIDDSVEESVEDTLAE